MYEAINIYVTCEKILLCRNIYCLHFRSFRAHTQVHLHSDIYAFNGRRSHNHEVTTFLAAKG